VVREKESGRPRGAKKWHGLIQGVMWAIWGWAGRLIKQPVDVWGSAWGQWRARMRGIESRALVCPVPDTKDTILSLRFVGDTERESSLAF
jgi:hypothetical protein